MDESRTGKEAPRKGIGDFLGLRKAPQEKKGKYVTVKEEKKRLKRVVKAKPMVRKHMAEALNAPTISEDDLRITETILETINAPTAPRPGPAAAKTFNCFECGAKVPYDSDRCPRCGSLYVLGLKDADVDEMLRAEQADDGTLDEIIRAARLPMVHFDAEIGVMQLLESDQGGPDIVFECNHCGALVEVNTDRCPICNTALKLGDTGLAGLFTDMEFDHDPLVDADCPFCGEHVALDSGKCPSCSAVVTGPNADAANRVNPILKAENVVFVHLDIETGAVNFLQRAKRNLRYDHASVQLDGIGTDGFDHDWSSLSRI